MSGSQFQQFNEDLNKMLGSTLPLCPFTTEKMGHSLMPRCNLVHYT